MCPAYNIWPVAVCVHVCTPTSQGRKGNSAPFSYISSFLKDRRSMMREEYAADLGNHFARDYGSTGWMGPDEMRLCEARPVVGRFCRL